MVEYRGNSTADKLQKYIPFINNVRQTFGLYSAKGSTFSFGDKGEHYGPLQQAGRSNRDNFYTRNKTYIYVQRWIHIIVHKK